MRFGWGRLLRSAISAYTALATVIATIPTAHGQEIIIDPSTPGVTLGATPLGTPLIGIATPGSGVSLNRFERLNVSPQGLILNNSTVAGQSRDGETLVANPNLISSGPASVIVNEVTGTGRSTLTGTTEVFGTSAKVIVANPNGILCDGCRFVRTTGTTLSTGTPVIDGLDVNLEVRKGTITIGQDGFKTSGDGALAGRHVIVDGVVETVDQNATDRLVVSGGAQDFDPDEGEGVQASTTVPKTYVYAVDATQFGALSSGSITIQGNELGLGVNAYGDLNAAGKVRLTAEGDLFYGNVTAGELEASSTAGEVRQYGDVTTTGNVTISGDAYTLYAGRRIESDGDVTVTTDGDIINVGDIDAVNITLLATGGQVANSGFVLADGELEIVAGNGLGNQREIATEYDVSIDPALQNYVEAYLAVLLEGGDEADIAAEMLARAEANEVVDQYVLAGASLSGTNVSLTTTGGDVRNEGGAIAATSDVRVDSANDIINKFVTTLHRLTETDGCTESDCGTREAFHPGEILAGGQIEMFAFQNIENRGSDIAAAADVVLEAGQDIVNTLRNSEYSITGETEYVGPGLQLQNVTCGDAKDGYYTCGTEYVVVSDMVHAAEAVRTDATLAPATISSLSGGVALLADRDYISVGSEVTAGGRIDVSALGKVFLGSFAAIDESFIRRPEVITTTSTVWVDKGETETVTSHSLTTVVDYEERELITAGSNLVGAAIAINAQDDVVINGARFFAETELEIESFLGSVLIDSAMIPGSITEDDTMAIRYVELDEQAAPQILNDSALTVDYLTAIAARPQLTAVEALRRAGSGADIKDAIRAVGAQGGTSLLQTGEADAVVTAIAAARTLSYQSYNDDLAAITAAIATESGAFQAELASLNLLFDSSDADEAAALDTRLQEIAQVRTGSRAVADSAYAATMAAIDSAYAGQLTTTGVTGQTCGKDGCTYTYGPVPNQTAIAAKQAEQDQALATRDNAYAVAEAVYLQDTAAAPAEVGLLYSDSAIQAQIDTAIADFATFMAAQDATASARTVQLQDELSDAAADAAVLAQAAAELDGVRDRTLAVGSTVQGEESLANALTDRTFGELKDIQQLAMDSDGVLRNSRTFDVQHEQIVQETIPVGHYEDQTILVDVQTQVLQNYTYACGKGETCTGQHWVTVTTQEEQTQTVWVQTGEEVIDVVETYTETVTTNNGVFAETAETQNDFIETTAWRFATGPGISDLGQTTRSIVSAGQFLDITSAEDTLLFGATTLSAGEDLVIVAGNRLGILGVADSRFQLSANTLTDFDAIAESLQERILLRGEDLTEQVTDYRLANTTLFSGGNVSLLALGSLTSHGASVGAMQNATLRSAAGDIVTGALRYAPDEGNIDGCGIQTCGVDGLRLLPGEIMAGGDILIEGLGSVETHGATFIAGDDIEISAAANISLSTIVQTDIFANGHYDVAHEILETSRLGSLGTRSLSLEGVSYTFLNDGNFVQAGGNLTISNADGDGDIALHALQGSVDGLLSITSSGDLSLYSATDVDRYQDSQGSVLLSLYKEEAVGADLQVAGDIILAGNLVALEGANLVSGGHLTLTAKDRLLVTTGQNYQSDSYSRTKRGFFRSSRRSISATALTHTPSHLGAGVDLRLASDADIMIAGSELVAGQDVFVNAAGDAVVREVTENQTYEAHSSSSFFGGFLFNRSSDITYRGSTALGSVIEALRDIDITADAGSVTLSASSFTAGGAINVNAGLGANASVDSRIRLAVATERIYQSLQSFSDNGLRWKSVSSGSDTQTVVQNEFDAADVIFNSNGLLDVQVGSSTAQTAEEQVADLLHTITGRDYASLSAAMASGEITVEEVETWQQQWNQTQTGVSPVAQLVVAVALSVAIGPESFALVSSSVPGAAVANAALAASASSLITNVVTGAIGGDLDFGQVFKSAALAGLTAGIAEGIDVGALLGMPEESLIGGKNLEHLFSPRALVDGAVDATISGAVIAASNGGDVGKAITQSLMTYTLTRAMAAAQFEIGELGLDEGHIAKIALHAVVGCAFAEARGGECASGAAAGASSELVSVALGVSSSQADLTAQRVETAVSGAVGGFTSLALSGDWNTGFAISSSATSFNRHLHTEELRFVAENAAAYAAEQGITEEQAAYDLKLEITRGVNDDLAHASINDNARHFLEQNATFYGQLIDGQTMFGDFYGTNNPEYINALVNINNVLVDSDYRSFLESMEIGGNRSALVLSFARALSENDREIDAVERQGFLTALRGGIQLRDEYQADAAAIFDSLPASYADLTPEQGAIFSKYPALVANSDGQPYLVAFELEERADFLNAGVAELFVHGSGFLTFAERLGGAKGDLAFLNEVAAANALAMSGIDGDGAAGRAIVQQIVRQTRRTALLRNSAADVSNPNPVTDIAALDAPPLPAGNLLDYEGPSKKQGHMIKKHVNVTDSDIIARANSQRPPVNGVSRFDDLYSADRLVKNTLVQKDQEFQAFMASEETRKEFDGVFPGISTGWHVDPHSSQLTRVHGVKVVLLKDSNWPGGFRVLTAFPTK